MTMIEWPDAPCRGQASLMFDINREQQAVNLCQTCPHITACRQQAIDNDEAWGVWGGTTPVDRGFRPRPADGKPAVRLSWHQLEQWLVRTGRIPPDPRPNDRMSYERRQWAAQIDAIVSEHTGLSVKTIRNNRNLDDLSKTTGRNIAHAFNTHPHHIWPDAYPANPKEPAA